MKPIKQRGGLYSPNVAENAIRLRHMIDLFERHNLKREATILNNLKIARSNYLHALAEKSKGGNYRIGAYTRSFKNAKFEARQLYNELMECSAANIFISPSTIAIYLQTECSCIT